MGEIRGAGEIRGDYLKVRVQTATHLLGKCTAAPPARKFLHPLVCGLVVLMAQQRVLVRAKEACVHGCVAVLSGRPAALAASMGAGSARSSSCSIAKSFKPT